MMKTRESLSAVYVITKYYKYYETKLLIFLISYPSDMNNAVMTCRDFMKALKMQKYSKNTLFLELSMTKRGNR